MRLEGCVRTALVEKLGAVDDELLKRFLTELALRFLDLLLRQGFFEQTLDGQGVPVRSLKQQLTAGIGRLDQVVGQHLFLGRKLGPDLATGRGTLHANGFRQRQRLDVSSLAEDVGNTSKNERECQKHRDAHHGFPVNVNSIAKSKRMLGVWSSSALAASAGIDLTRRWQLRQWIGRRTRRRFRPIVSVSSAHAGAAGDRECWPIDPNRVRVL